MRVPTGIICLWPGLPRVWSRGDWTALVWAVTFAVLLNCTLVVSFIWPELVSSTFRFAMYWVLIAVWVGSVAWYAWRLRLEDRPSAKVADLDALYGRAQDECLKGDWYQAEGTLRRLLRASPEDADGRLLLATLMRHTGRLEESRQQLKRLEQLESSQKWRLEIEREYERLDSLATDHAPDESVTDDEVDVVMVAEEEPAQSTGASEAA